MSWIGSTSQKLQLAILAILCIVAFFLRSYATYRDLIFAYDQGRDALMMRSIQSGDVKLIGPVTGLDGVYLGPFWYYLIFLFYFLGGGNPVFPAIEMKLFSVGVVVLMFLWGRKAKLPWFGLFGGLLYACSFSNILFARWLSNPVPLPFFALLGFYLLWNAIEKKQAWLYGVTGIVFGLCLQLEAANAIWFLPTIGVILFSEYFCLREKISVRMFLRMGLALGIGWTLTILPQLVFELKNNFLITKNLIRAFQSTHDISIIANLPMRLALLTQLYGRSLFERQSWIIIFLCGVFILGLLLFHKALFASRAWRIALYWFCVPFFFHLIYTGNHGNFWDYYLIAQHVSLILLVVMTLGVVSQNHKWRAFVLTFAFIFGISSLSLNLWKWQEIVPPYLGRFSLEEQVDAIRWMSVQAQGQPYGAWVYTPSAQDDPYRYLFQWVGAQIGTYPEEHVEVQPIIFLVVEDDPIYWSRRRDWIKQGEKFGSLLESKRFGSIVVFKLKNTFFQQIVQ